jgi:hypothetical protein
MKLAEKTQLIEDRINAVIDILTKRYYKQYPQREEYPDYLNHEIVRGTKYYKIIQVTNSGAGNVGRSVHAFVSRETGAVYKPASWKAPALHVRYQLLDDASYEACLHNADWAGAYLYMR